MRRRRTDLSRRITGVPGSFRRSHEWLRYAFGITLAGVTRSRKVLCLAIDDRAIRELQMLHDVFTTSSSHFSCSVTHQR